MSMLVGQSVHGRKVKGKERNGKLKSRNWGKFDYYHYFSIKHIFLEDQTTESYETVGKDKMQKGILNNWFIEDQTAENQEIVGKETNKKGKHFFSLLPFSFLFFT